MTEKEIISKIASSNDHRVKLAVVDVDGVLRGKMVHREKFLDAVNNEFGFCDVIFGWDMLDAAYDNAEVTGWHSGYPDAKASIDLTTFRTIPWEEDIPFFLADFSKIDHPACPRNLLKRVAKKAEGMGFETQFAQEFEWFNFQKNPESSYRNPDPITKGMFGYSILRASQNSAFFNDLFVLLERFRVPIEGMHTETGPGVYEACVQYTNVLEAADRASLFKTAVKEIASRHNYVASFMAKWNQSLPGCSGHIHQSLKKDGKAAFYDDTKENKISSLLQSYIAGQLACLPYILPMYAPTINSYKRLVEGAWAPTTITWGLDNRTTALRVINVNEKATRLETRVPGSDSNPYLAMAAALASGLYGIEKNLKLNQAPTVGNGYKDKSNGTLPPNLEAANHQMKNSDLAKQLFGEGFVDHFTRTRDWEHRQYAAAVTDWELKRYFEII